MNKSELFDIIELLVDVPEYNLKVGTQGTIVECYDGQFYEIEFANSQGETELTCALSEKDFIVVWQAASKTWLFISNKAEILINLLSDNDQTKVLEFARSLHSK
jgi:hypothetical protein